MKEQVCLCGQKFELSSHSNGSGYTDYSGKCLSCNRTLWISEKLWPWGKDDYFWGNPRKFLTCDSCGGEFFAHKILSGDLVNWVMCVQCRTEKDLRK
jgi:hypothetical protein